MIGLFFGSFNPIHVGHLILANYMLSFHDIDELWFVISPHNPLKNKKTLLDEKQRLNMVNAAIDEMPKMRASSIEFGLPQPSYTIHTMVALEEKYPNKKFTLIMGADTISSITKWKNYELLLEKYPILVYPRIGFELSKEFLDSLPNSNIKLTEAPTIEISSTFIRSAIKGKKDVRFFLPKNVFTYIDEMNLYKN